MQVVRAHEMEKISKNRKSLFKDANRYAAEYNLTCEFNSTNTILKDIDGKTTPINSRSPHAIKDLLRQALQKKYLENMKEQAWLGALTAKQLEDPDMAPNANQVFEKWKNIPDIVYSVDKGIRQQLLPTRTYQQTKLQTQVSNTKCRMCDSQIETTFHILSRCSKLIQSLYKATHDRILRQIYNHLLQKHNFQESNNKKPWYMQSIPTAVVENANAKILWDTPFQLESAPENGANKIDIAVLTSKAS